MFYSPEQVLSICSKHFSLDPDIPFNLQEKAHRAYCRQVMLELTDGKEDHKLFNMLRNLPSPHRQQKVLHRLTVIASEYGCELSHLEWWDISTNSERFLVGHLHMNGQIGEVRFIWQSAEKNSIDLSNTVTPIPFAHNQTFQFAYEIQAREYEALKQRFRTWLSEQVIPSQYSIAVSA